MAYLGMFGNYGIYKFPILFALRGVGNEDEQS